MSENNKPLRLEAGFWDFSERLKLIHDYALARFVSPDALLFSMLARIGAAVSPALQIPGFVGTPANPSLCVAVVGSAGTGKSTANSLARELLDIRLEQYRFDLTSGTGQGIVESYLRTVRKGEGHDEGEKVQKFLGCHFYIDEGSQLLAASSKKEDITTDTIRSLWSGQPAGQQNASSSTSRRLEAKSYSFGFVVGFQPDPAAAFVTLGKGVGTPQRFLWCYADYPEQPTDPDDISTPFPFVPIQGQGFFRYDDIVKREIQRERAAAQRGEIVRGELEGHESMKRLKVAACLAMLEGEKFIDESRWEVARMITDVSWNVLCDIRDKGVEREQARRHELYDNHAERSIRTKEKTQATALAQGAATMARKLHRAFEVLTASDLNQAVSSEDKRLASTEEMIAYMLEKKWAEIVPSTSTAKQKYKAGSVTPPAPRS
jgi:hypothetical protein